MESCQRARAPVAVGIAPQHEPIELLDEALVVEAGETQLELEGVHARIVSGAANQGEPTARETGKRKASRLQRADSQPSRFRNVTQSERPARRPVTRATWLPP